MAKSAEKTTMVLSLVRGSVACCICVYAGTDEALRYQQMSVPPTEGIKYAGSKLKLLPHILELAARVEPKTVFDGFAGTTRVSQALAQCGYRVIANDIAAWS